MKRDNETTITLDSAEIYAIPKVIIRVLYDGHLGIIDDFERTVDSDPLLIGRSAEEDGIKLMDPSVSRQHARIVPNTNSGEVRLEDASRNGSFVNGQPVDSVALNNGDIIRIGNSFLLVRYRLTKDGDGDIPALHGHSPEMRQLRRSIERVAPTKATVLISGESGTGKELVAKALHELSGRSGPFVPVNCAAIPSALAESQLFGHIVGSFTGAKENHDGFFRQSNRGTLLLDEVGELPPEIQPKLLRVLEDREVVPVGGVNPIPLDIRIIAATNRDLENAIDRQLFRGDLFARLAELTIRTPTLKARREDILPLFRLGFCDKLPNLSPELVEMLLFHPWRYNVRELFKVATELKIQANYTSRLEPSHVQHRLIRNMTTTPTEPPVAQPTPQEAIQLPPEKATQPLRTREPVPNRKDVEDALRKSGGNISQLSRMLGRSRRQVYRYLEMYNLNPDVYRP